MGLISGKRAIELSLNFIVIIIISITLFIFGIRFMSQLSSQAFELQKLTLDDLDARIANFACEGSDRVCIGADRQTIPKGKFGVFGVKILNVLDPQSGQGQDFEITVALSTFVPKNNPSASGPPLEIKPKARNVFIKANEEKEAGIGIEVPKTAEPGTYVFNIQIKTNIKQADGSYIFSSYTSAPLKVYVDVP